VNTHVDVESTISISSPSSWSPPPTSSFKLNIDASGLVDNKWGVVDICQGDIIHTSAIREELNKHRQGDIILEIRVHVPPI